MTPLRILIADDRPIFRAGVQGLLREFPDLRVVAEATTGRQAVELARRYRPDVVLMDLNMPEMGGIAATRLIKSQQPETTILALTVSEAEEDVVDMVTAGASGYVLKDVDPDRLARSIREAHAGRFQLDDELTRRVITRLGAGMRRAGVPSPADHLTEREREVLRMVMLGKSNKAIGDHLGVSDGTVKSHLRNVYRKLRVGGRAAAAAAGARLDV
ncbi:MAG TPA: response regulator transcription factor [Candidatus Limnocylindrales bacterium]|nr:response regulator transcription factor [Candidatus Limnocylindrales bacterium]